MPTESRNQRRPVYLRFPERYEYLPKRINNYAANMQPVFSFGKKRVQTETHHQSRALMMPGRNLSLFIPATKIKRFSRFFLFNNR